MSKKINIAFLAPETKGGPYYIYKDIVEFFKQQYNDEIEVSFCHSKIDWIKLHFKKYDVVCSVIPFLFKPLGTRKYVYNPRGNFDIEKKKNNLGNKLLYLARINLFFADKIWLNSYFLADVLNFRNRYKNKIFISPDFIDIHGLTKVRKKKSGVKKIKILTVSSTKFLEKAKGLIDLGRQVSGISNQDIEWTIIAGGNENNTKKIKQEFDTINIPESIQIKWLDWVEKKNLATYYEKSDVFLYGSRLDTWGGVIMEAMSYGLPAILLKYELWRYIYPDTLITDDVDSKLSDIEEHYEQYSKISVDMANQFELSKVIAELKKEFI